jgi:hypothetical protein
MSELDKNSKTSMKERYIRFLCWLRGHTWNAGHAHGWSGYVTYQCRRCRCITSTQFDF